MGILARMSGANKTEASDVDVLIDFEQAPSLLKFIEVENYLSNAIVIKVDLVMK
jgi:predicted nucleotidyltransferase